MRLAISSEGFTMLEVIIVLVLLSTLTLVATSKFSDINKDAKASTLRSVAGALKASFQLIHTKALLEKRASGEQEITYNGVKISLFNGYPSINGRASFNLINNQLRALLDLDIVDRNTAKISPKSNRFFSDKWSRENRLYIFFSEDFSQKSVSFACHIMYENSVESKGPQIIIRTTAC